MKRIIVIGGGIGGLCTAIALRKVGIDAVVYEQAEQLDEVGAGLTIWTNAVKALRSIGLADEVINAGKKIRRGEVRTPKGTVLTRTPFQELERLFGEPSVALHRADLHRVLLDALPSDSVRIGMKCVGFKQDKDKITVSFSDGNREEADFLVGADGIHSVVREMLFPEISLRYSGYTVWRGVVNWENEIDLKTTSETLGRGSRFGIVPIGGKRIYWYATANTPAGQKQTPAERKKYLLAQFKDWHQPIERLIESTPEKFILHNDIFDIAPLKCWHNNRVVLLGDAAHPTTPNLGQGACLAIESAVVLARCLSQTDDWAAALRRYEIERMPRTAWINEQSWRTGKIGQLEGRLSCTLRNFILRATPHFIMRKPLEKAVGFQI
jgi:2-polyprenyl-6-methoxyphenol hydroxylase-like FAD-dependent oxidoreductase